MQSIYLQFKLIHFRVVTHCNYRYHVECDRFKQIKRAASRRTHAVSQRTCEARVKRYSNTQSDQTDVRASIYEHPPFYKGEKKWDDNDTLLEVYKLQSNTPQNKAELKSIRITAVTQSNSQSIKRSSNLIKGQKSVNSPGSTPLRSSKMCSKVSTGLLGSRRSMSTFRSLSTRQGQCRASKIATLAKKMSSYRALSSADAEQKEA